MEKKPDFDFYKELKEEIIKIKEVIRKWGAAPSHIFLNKTNDRKKYITESAWKFLKNLGYKETDNRNGEKFLFPPSK